MAKKMKQLSIYDINFRVSIGRVKRIKKKAFVTLVFDNQTYNTITGRKMAITLVPEQTVQITLKPVDRKGKPAQLDSVEYTSSNESVATVSTGDDMLTATITSVGVGVATINIVADADLDDDEIRALEDFIAVEVKAEEATAFGTIEVGTPADVTGPVEPQ